MSGTSSKFNIVYIMHLPYVKNFYTRQSNENQFALCNTLDLQSIYVTRYRVFLKFEGNLLGSFEHLFRNSEFRWERHYFFEDK